MDKLLLMTDLHICAPGETIIGLDPSQRLQAAIDAALTDHSDASALILMGDLTHHGLPIEYMELKRVLDAVPLPIIPMLGNHDRREAFLEIFPDAPQTRHGHIQHKQDLTHHRIITLGTLDGPPYPNGPHAGRLCRDKMHFLRNALAGADDKAPLVFAHHPPFKTGVVSMDLIRLEDGKELLDTLKPHKSAHLICGHIHLTISGSTNGMSWSMLKSTCHQGVLDMHDPDSSLSVDTPGSYGVVLLDRDSVVVHSVDVGAPPKIERDPHSQ